MNKNLLFQQCKELISLYLTTGDTLNYGKEIKIAKKLLQNYPIEFFLQYDPQTKFHSLSVFLTKQGKKTLDKEFQMYKLVQPAPEIKLEKSPVINIEQKVEKDKKSKTLLEFVDEML